MPSLCHKVRIAVVPPPVLTRIVAGPGRRLISERRRDSTALSSAFEDQNANPSYKMRSCEIGCDAVMPEIPHDRDAARVVGVFLYLPSVKCPPWRSIDFYSERLLALGHYPLVIFHGRLAHARSFHRRDINNCRFPPVRVSAGGLRPRACRESAGWMDRPSRRDLSGDGSTRRVGQNVRAALIARSLV